MIILEELQKLTSEAGKSVDCLQYVKKILNTKILDLFHFPFASLWDNLVAFLVQILAKLFLFHNFFYLQNTALTEEEITFIKT